MKNLVLEIFKPAMSFILAFSLIVGAGMPKGFAVSDDDEDEAITREVEQYLEDLEKREREDELSKRQVYDYDTDTEKDDKSDLVDPDEVDTFLELHEDYFPSGKKFWLRKKLLKLKRKNFKNLIVYAGLRNPNVALLISLLIGGLGIDRFFVGDIGSGVLKLITGGGFGFWYIIDWFLIRGRAREYNFKKFKKILK